MLIILKTAKHQIFLRQTSMNTYQSSELFNSKKKVEDHNLSVLVIKLITESVVPPFHNFYGHIRAKKKMVMRESTILTIDLISSMIKTYRGLAITILFLGNSALVVELIFFINSGNIHMLTFSSFREVHDYSSASLKKVCIMFDVMNNTQLNYRLHNSNDTRECHYSSDNSNHFSTDYISSEMLSEYLTASDISLVSHIVAASNLTSDQNCSDSSEIYADGCDQVEYNFEPYFHESVYSESTVKHFDRTKQPKSQIQHHSSSIKVAKKKGRPKTKSSPAKKKSGKLWEFLKNLLHDQSTCPSLIKWEDYNKGIFKFIQSDKVAKLWGQRTNNKNMNFEKFSRAMRYYYRQNILVSYKKRLSYQFGPNAKGWQTANPILN